jgi:hypothetical protein
MKKKEVKKGAEAERLIEVKLNITDHGNLCCELEFIQSTLDIVFEATASANFQFDGPNWHPIVYEAVKKIEGVRELIGGMKFESQAA